MHVKNGLDQAVEHRQVGVHTLCNLLQQGEADSMKKLAPGHLGKKAAAGMCASPDPRTFRCFWMLSHASMHAGLTTLAKLDQAKPADASSPKDQVKANGCNGERSSDVRTFNW